MKEFLGRDERTVWVLGAGFSRSLGGPLLSDLFRPVTWGELKARFDSQALGNLAATLFAVQRIYHWGFETAKYWRDAEEFLEQADRAGQDDPGAKARIENAMSNMLRALLIDAELGPHLGENRRPNESPAAPGVIHDRARRALAAECSWFCETADVESERWRPYQQWLDSLVPGCDTIVSFNYDTVLETIDAKRDPKRPRLEVMLPAAPRAPREGRIPLLKLHGSADWRWTKEQRVERSSVAATLAAPDARIAIASPGRSKANDVRQMFEPLWEEAMDAIEGARFVIFLGYRLPPSDSDARRRILRAISNNQGAMGCLHLWTALGQDVNAPDTRRMREMLHLAATVSRQPVAEWKRDEAAMFSAATPKQRFARVCALPLLVEDFLTLHAEGGALSHLPLHHAGK